MDPEDHPSNNMPDATVPHWGTELSAGLPTPANDNNPVDYSLSHKIWSKAPKLSPKLGESK